MQIKSFSVDRKWQIKSKSPVAGVSRSINTYHQASSNKPYSEKGNPSQVTRSNPGKPKCNFCNKPGHYWRNCHAAPKSFVPTMSMIFDMVRDETFGVDSNSNEVKDENVTTDEEINSDNSQSESQCESCHRTYHT